MSQLLLNYYKTQGHVGYGSARCGHMNRDILQYWRGKYDDDLMPIHYLIRYYPTLMLVRQSAKDKPEEIMHKQQQKRMKILILPKIKMQHVFIDLLTLADLKEKII